MKSDQGAEQLKPFRTWPAEAKPMIERALEEMLSSVPFRTSRQCQDLLRYIVLHSLNGEEESLRERIIGVEVFGRKPDYDQAADPVVRIRAADVRKRLALFYEQSADGAGGVKIAIPSGSYRACFEFRNSSDGSLAPKEEVSPEVLPSGNQLDTSTNIDKEEGFRSVDAPDKTTRSPKASLLQSRLFPFLLILLLIVAGISYMLMTEIPDTALQRFWSPVLKDQHRSLIYLGGNTVFSFSAPFIERYRQEHHLSSNDEAKHELELSLGPQDTLKGEDLYRLVDTYVSIGDVAASAKVASFLSVEKKAYDMRFNQDISVGDLRQGPAILIGGFNNTWTLQLTDSLRFVFASGYRVQDRFDPHRFWKPVQNTTEDYAIVSRVLNSKTGEILITAAGLGQAGTWAAGEFITNPKALDSFSHVAPKGWERKNSQIVLHTTVINGSPSEPDIVATYYW